MITGTRRLWLVLVVIAALVLADAAIDHFDAFSSYRSFASSRTVPNTLVASGRTGNELRLSESGSQTSFRLEKFAESVSPADMPSTTVLSEIAAQTRLDLVSIVLDPEYLTDDDIGLASNFDMRGRSWERPSYMSYFEGGELRFGSGAGIRVHGGKSRQMANKSYRLYFRSMYGDQQPTEAEFFRARGEAALPSIVIHNDVRMTNGQPWHYVNPLTYELAAAIGCITPRTRPVQLYVNGALQGPYVLTEHISKTFLTARFGHDDFVVVEMKMDEPGNDPVEHGDADKFEELVEWVDGTPAPLDFAELVQRIDVENLTNWALSIVYAGVTDPFQGVALFDETKRDGRWFWINWDMDHAFSDRYNQAENDWDIDNFYGRSGILNTKRGLRSRLLQKLLPENPQYRLYFLTRMTKVLNHVLTPEFVEKKVAEYREMALEHGVADDSNFDSIVKYAYQRPGALRRQAGDYLGAGPAYELRVENPDRFNLTVDQYPVGAAYKGYYFGETAAVIDLPGTDRDGIVITVDGQVHDSSALPLILELVADSRVKIGASVSQ